MNLRNFYGKITCDYAWELETFYKRRDFEDGVEFFDLDIHWDRYCGDHNPQFIFSLTILNLTVFNFSIYNVYHIDNPKSPFYQQFFREEEEEKLAKLERRSVWKDADGPNYEADQE